MNLLILFIALCGFSVERADYTPVIDGEINDLCWQSVEPVGGEDRNWDAVWSSAVAMNDSGWTVEVALPFSILRYSPAEEQVWGMNFGRTISSTNEAAYMFRMKEQGGTDVSCFGDLTGLCDLPSSHRIEIRPFVAGRLQFGGGDGLFSDPWGSAGVDLKIPLTMQTVLDVTVNPDFGQIESDADQGNISHWAPWLREKDPSSWRVPRSLICRSICFIPETLVLLPGTVNSYLFSAERRSQELRAN